MLPLIFGLLAAGTALSAVGQWRAGGAAKKAGESAAQQQEWNARVAEVQAQDAIARGQEAEQNFRTQVRGLLGTQRAGFATQGVDIGVGSPLDVQAHAAYLGELDALQLRANAAREAWGDRVEARDRRFAANVARRGGEVQATAGRWGAGATALSGAGNLLLAKYGWDQQQRPRN